MGLEIFPKLPNELFHNVNFCYWNFSPVSFSPGNYQLKPLISKFGFFKLIPKFLSWESQSFSLKSPNSFPNFGLGQIHKSIYFHQLKQPGTTHGQAHVLTRIFTGVFKPLGKSTGLNSNPLAKSFGLDPNQLGVEIGNSPLWALFKPLFKETP